MPSENSWRILGNLRKGFGNLRKTVKKVAIDILYNKQNNNWLLIGMKFLISLRLLVRYQVQNSETNSIPTHTHVLPSIYTSCLTILLIMLLVFFLDACHYSLKSTYDVYHDPNDSLTKLLFRGVLCRFLIANVTACSAV